MVEYLPDTNVGNIEYIRKQDAVDALEAKKDKSAKGDIGCFYNTIIQNTIDALNGLPSADVAPVRHGHWTLVGWHKGMKIMECSCCKKRAIGATDFCPNCGAKMDGGES